MDNIPPDIFIGPLKIWIHGYEFPESEEYWDANWLRISANLTTDSSQSWIRNNPALRTSEIYSFIRNVDSVTGARLHSRWVAEMQTLESQISWVVEKLSRDSDDLQMSFELSGSLEAETHHIHISLLPSELEGFIDQCRAVLTRFPVKSIEESSK